MERREYDIHTVKTGGVEFASLVGLVIVGESSGREKNVQQQKNDETTKPVHHGTARGPAKGCMS
jgi:hypothetical protein